jgi:hypothetical protein
MGLDMYLTKEIYVKNWPHREDQWQIDVACGSEKVELVFPISKLVLDVAYWRKANAIHKWFVDYCQEGRDECQNTYVDREQLQELVGICKKVLALAQTKEAPVNVGTCWTQEKGMEQLTEPGKVITNIEEIAELLPAEDGYFFGSTDYDSGYLQDVTNTINQLEAALADPLQGDFYYHSSW